MCGPTTESSLYDMYIVCIILLLYVGMLSGGGPRDTDMDTSDGNELVQSYLLRITACTLYIAVALPSYNC